MSSDLMAVYLNKKRKFQVLEVKCSSLFSCESGGAPLVLVQSFHIYSLVCKKST